MVKPTKLLFSHSRTVNFDLVDSTRVASRQTLVVAVGRRSKWLVKRQRGEKLALLFEY